MLTAPVDTTPVARTGASAGLEGFLMELFAAFPAAVGRSLPQILAQSGPVGLTILLITFALSVMTWAVAWDRARLYSKLRSRGDQVRRAAGRRGIAAVMHEAEDYLPALEAAILIEANGFVQANGGDAGVVVVDDTAGLEQERNRCEGFSMVVPSMKLARWSGISFLSTTSAGAPFSASSTVGIMQAS